MTRSTAARGRCRIPLAGGGALDLGPRTLVMGIVNITPDSFSDGGRHFTPEAAIAHAHHLVSEGADILDLGAESTRPGADPVPVHEEIDRLRPVLRRLAGHVPVPISVDTMKPEVAEAALDDGAAIVNDVSMLRHGDDLARLAAERGAALVLMHSRGTPATMRGLTDYPQGVVAGVADELKQAMATARAAGVAAEKIIADPGIGFAKTADQSLELLRRMPELAAALAGYPLLIGVSRKSFIGAILDVEPDERGHGTLAAESAAILGGAHIIRTHDARAARQAADILDAMMQSLIHEAA